MLQVTGGGHPGGLPLGEKLLTHAEGLPQERADPVVPLAGRVVDQGGDPHDLRDAVLTKHLRVGLDVDDLADELVVEAELDHLQQAALQHHGKFGGVGGVHQLAFHLGEPGGAELVTALPRGDPHEVRLCHAPLDGHGNGEGPTGGDGGVGVARLAQGDGDAGGIGAADAAPGGVHQVGLAVGVVAADHQHGGGEEETLCSEGLFHLGLLLVSVTPAASGSEGVETKKP